MEPDYSNYEYNTGGLPAEASPNSMRLKLLGALVIVLLISALWLLASRSTLQITVDGGSGSGQYNYTITDSAGKSTTVQSSDTTLKKTVSRGTYQVAVTSDETSFLSTVTTESFLRTTNVAADLQPENARQFVGTNPDSCMYLTAKLISGPCGVTLDQLKVHVPATTTAPSYTDKLPLGSFNPSSGNVQIVQTKNGWFGLMNQAQENENRQPGYYLLTLTPNFSVGSIAALKGLSKDDIYNARAYKDGLLIYTISLDKAYYITSASAAPATIAIDKPNNDKLTQVSSVSVSGQAITAQYSDQSAGQNGEGDDPALASKGRSEVVVADNGSQQHYNFGKVFRTIQSCGTSKLCGIANNMFEVYETDGSKAKLLYSTSGVTDLFDAAGQLMLVNAAGITTYDPDQASGHLNYSLGKYQFCGTSPADNGYLLCVIDAKGTRQALYVNLQVKNTGSIDKKVYDLPNIPNVTAVSVYGNYIFISPDYGQTTYDWSTHSIGYDPNQVKAVNTAIDQAVAKQGLNKAPFVVVNTGQQP